MAKSKVKAYKVVVPITTHVVWVECAESEEEAVKNVERDIAMRIGRGWGEQQMIDNEKIGKPYIEKTL